MRGKFIAIDGGEGAGKDTQINRLKNELGEKDFLFVRDPGGTEMGEKIREVLLSPGSDKVGQRTEVLLYLASRSQLVSQIILPALERGQNVIANRFFLSTIAYQVYARGQEPLRDFIVEASNYANYGLKPDFYILLDVTPEVGLSRVKKGRDYLDRFETAGILFHEKVRAGYKKEIVNFNHAIINADMPVDDVYTEFSKALKNFLKIK